MSLYAAQSALQLDTAFQQRVAACVNQETMAWVEPPTDTIAQILVGIMPDVAASPGFAEKYLYGVQAEGKVPGQLAITDGEILATVQPMLEAWRPQGGGAA